MLIYFNTFPHTFTLSPPEIVIFIFKHKIQFPFHYTSSNSHLNMIFSFLHISHRTTVPISLFFALTMEKFSHYAGQFFPLRVTMINQTSHQYTTTNLDFLLFRLLLQSSTKHIFPHHNPLSSTESKPFHLFLHWGKEREKAQFCLMR